MKFSAKLILSVTVIVSILFSLGGTLLVARNFSHALENAAAQNTGQHMLERYAIESSILGYVLGGAPYSNEKLKEYALRMTDYSDAASRLIGLYGEDGAVIAENLPALPDEDKQAALMQGEDTYLLRRTAGRTFMIVTSRMAVASHQATLVGAYDVTALYHERDRQLREFLLLDALISLLSVAAVGILSTILTRPIQKLNIASRNIAAGAYHERTEIRTRDEIGELSMSFDSMAAAVEARIHQLDDALRQRDDFISAFSHEIKTPMTSIIGYADILRTAAVDKEKQLRYASLIYQEGKRLEELSRKLMELMALTEKRSVLVPIQAEGMLLRLKRRMDAAWDGVQVQVEADTVPVMADGALLECLLANLLHNARKSEPRDAVVYLTGKRFGPRYRITVEDRGCGIPPDELARITEPFYMVDKSRSRAQGGAGLGLYLGERIARIHGTALHFESAPGEGTRVWVELEVMADASADQDR
ncbi:sensor histidine kinase [Zongyangia hominis]|uniref:histidine kinase n=1 Tax=Zongyangia hominis TaxID=2763677 RepID=A0A926EDM5_9FIRM|nr:HAMP domain-containing sensor histidine kinase [Zongyangia hominis]MBC8570484.1 HAMP domain-containing histidine kinase [Zongyangia hominis]